MANEPEVLRGMLANRVAKSARHLAKWAKRERVTCYRVYDRDIPEIPVAIDRYEEDLVMHDFRASDRGGGEPWLEAMIAGARDALPGTREVFVKARERLAHRGDGEQYERGPERASIVRAVAEGGHAFKINLSDYIDVGLFLDHRTTRKLVAAEAGETLLNLFAYTGAFSVYAHGAGKRTTTVDLSNTYVEWARENFELNEMRGGEFVREDVRTFLQTARANGRKWDVVIADVPTFSNSKSTAYTWDVQRDHVAFLDDLAAVTSPAGTIWFATNNRRFKFGWTHKNWRAEPMSAKTLPPDFRDQRIHQTFRIAR
jgi:23S rRNA G2069 N7-methylase RlmK/C1962 C5-methylase RlmI